jgi:hypothetical protein
MRGVPARCLWLSPGDWRTWRVTIGPAQLAERVIHGALRRGAGCAGCGASARRAAARDDALSRKRKWARLPRHLRRESPTLLAASAQNSPLVHALRACPAHHSRVSGLGRSAWRAEGAPLKTYREFSPIGQHMLSTPRVR